MKVWLEKHMLPIFRDFFEFFSNICLKFLENHKFQVYKDLLEFVGNIYMKLIFL